MMAKPIPLSMVKVFEGRNDPRVTRDNPYYNNPNLNSMTLEDFMGAGLLNMYLGSRWMTNSAA
jgi:hypothetical protein